MLDFTSSHCLSARDWAWVSFSQPRSSKLHPICRLVKKSGEVLEISSLLVTKLVAQSYMTVKWTQIRAHLPFLAMCFRSCCPLPSPSTCLSLNPAHGRAPTLALIRCERHRVPASCELPVHVCTSEGCIPVCSAGSPGCLRALA